MWYDKSMTNGLVEQIMANVKKIAISIDSDLLERLDALVSNKAFKNRSHAFQSAVDSMLDSMEHRQLELECMKLDSDYESKLADETSEDEEWPEY